jgi:NAD-dependent dihydropyrimidine dehydrogenase PreA subunit
MRLQRGSTNSCQPQAGRIVPVIDRNRCEGKEDCVRVCPYHVFEIRKLEPEQRRALGLLGKVKALAHGNRQAFVVRGEECHACALCVPACPERAIRLVAFDDEAEGG